MAQVINSSDELLDGAQIANKLASALKTGQIAFATNDLECYDIAQISAKYNIGLSQVYSLAPTNRLPAHLGYFPLATFRYGNSPLAAYNAGETTYYFLDPTFNGTNLSTVVVGSVLYEEYNNAQDNIIASAGYYMLPNNSYWIIGANGAITGSGTYTPDALQNTFPYCYLDTDSSADLATLAQEVNQMSYATGWGNALGTIYQRSSDHLWYNSYDPNSGTFGYVVTGTFVREGEYQGLDYYFVKVSAGNQLSEGYRYKRPILSALSYTATIGASGGNITVTVTSYIKWQAQVTSGDGYINGQAYGEGNGSFIVTVNPNSSSARNIAFSVTDRWGFVSAQTGSISQAAAPPAYTEVAYEGFTYLTGDLTQDKYDAYNSNWIGFLYLTGGVYYQDTACTVPADNGIYLTYKGIDQYPNYPGSTWLILN